MSELDKAFTEKETLRAEVRELRLENESLRARVRELDPGALTIPEVTTEDETPPATNSITDYDGQIAPSTGGPPYQGYDHKPTPPRPARANEVLPPERRASWAKGRTEHDK